MRYRKKDLSHNVLVAVSRWVKANGGKVIVIGGIGVMEHSEHKYSICVKVVGKKPTKSSKEK